MIVVLAMMGLAVAVAVPLVSHQVRMARIRGAADQFAGDLRAVRMIAVSQRQTASVQVFAEPDNYYSYPDARRKGSRTVADWDERRVEMPDGVRIISSTSPIAFKADGSVPGGATTILEAETSGGSVDRWTVTIGILGIARTVHQGLD